LCKKFNYNKSLTNMKIKREDKLSSERFMRVHKSYIIALDKVESVRKTQLMIGGSKLPIGEGYGDILQNYVNLKTYK
jgi:two-component system LytT family response regulator